ncbi:MAG: SCO family protein [Acidobacteria bacterium]|nr:SCO family protein [Acidobacteriota bacterium]
MARPTRRALVPLAALLAASCAKRYPVRGIVVRPNPTAGTALIAHRAIPGYMPAMAMEFRARSPRDLTALRPGTRVSFTLRKGLAERVRILSDAFDPTEVDLSQAPPKPAIGAPIPEFTLTTHRGAPLALSSLRGRWVAVNFIYTRCPLPEVCPRLTATFAALQRRFRDAPVSFLSLTLDPRYDTPPILAEYARRTAAGANWHFLTGPPDELARVARAFGLWSWVEEGVIVHNSTTALIAPDGRLAALVEGSSFALEEIDGLLRYSLTPP